MLAYAVVFVGAGIGGALRHGVNLGSARLFGVGFPYGTFTVNVVGSLIMGLIAGWFAFKGGATGHLRLFLATGIMGGFTTFSAFSLETALMIERRAYGTAAAYSLASVILSVVALFAGLLLMRRLLA